MKQFNQLKQNFVSKLRDYTNPMIILIPWLNAFFQKYMGNYFNEEIQREKFTTMGLKKLTLKVSTFNQMNLPFVLIEGGVGLLQLDLKTLTCKVEDVEIHLGLRTLAQYQQFQQSYQKQQQWADRLQKFKDEIIQKIQLRQEDPNYDAWNIIRQLMQKITIQFKNILVHIHCDQLLTIAIQNICLRVRKLQYEKDQAVSTIILGGMSIHLNDQVSNDIYNFKRDSCIFSLQQIYQQEKYDQYMVIHLRTHLQNRIKFSSTISLKYVKFCFNFTQMNLFIKVLLQIIENQKQFLQQHVVDLQSYKKEEQQVQHYFTWTDSKYMPSYLIQEEQGGQGEKDVKDESVDSIEGGFSFDDDEELLQSEYNIEYMESQIIEEREPLKQSLYSESVFKEFVNDDEDKQGLGDLDDEHLILRINIQNISMELAQNIDERWGNIKSDKYLILLQNINYQIMKEGSNTKTTIKNSNLDIEEVQMWYNKYIQLEWSEQVKFDSDLFHSCHEFSVESQLKQNYQNFMEQHGKHCQSNRLLIHIYSGVKINQPIIEEENGVFIENIHSSSKYTKEGMAIKFKMQNVRNQQSVSIANVDIQCEMQNIIDLMELIPQKSENPNKNEIKSIPNLNLFTIHNVQAYYLHQVNSQELIDKLFSDRLNVSQDYRFLTLSATCQELQIQQEITSFITFNNIDFSLNKFNGSIFDSQSIGTICSYRKSLIKLQQPRFNSNILTHRPNICIGLSEVAYFYDKSHLVIADDILQQFKTKQTQAKQQPFTIKFIIEEVIIRIQNRILIHIHKLFSLITNFNECEVDKFLTIYNLCVVDQNRYVNKEINEIPIYSSISDTPKYNTIDEIIQKQILHFNNDKYSAYQVLFYKQERFNRLTFKDAFFEDALKYEDIMGFQQTLENLQDSKFINPDDNTLIQNNSNILTLSMRQEKSVHITLQHGIQQLDEQLLELVDFIQYNLPPKKEQDKQQQIKIRVTVNNILLNYFPTYKESTLLKQHLMKTEFVRQVKHSHQKEQTFFSWVRVVVRVKASELQLNPSEYFHVKSLQVFCKSTSRPNISYLNPILLVPPSTLYLGSRCFTQGFQLDADEQQLLYLLCFKKLMSFNGITYLEKKLELSNISMSLCLDSCVSLMDLVWMTMEKVEKIDQKLYFENNSSSTSLSQFTQEFDIFEADDIHHSISLPQSVPTLQLTVSTLRVLFQDGRTFPAEMFEPAENVQNDEANQAGQYFCEHKSLEQYEEVPQTSEHKDGLELVIQQVSGTLYQKSSLSLQISSIEIQDKVKKSKFSKILGQDKAVEQHQLFMQMDLSSDISLQFEIQPFRICLSGATLDFFYELLKIEEQPTPKVIYQSELNKSISMSKQQIKDLCQKRGFDVYFQHPNHQKISIKELIIERIKIIITIDGQGAENQKYRHLIKIVKYDNLTVALKKAHIYNMQFERQSELQKLLIDQYINQLKNDNVFIQSLFTQYKMFNNVTNIIQGFKMLLLTMIKKGVRAGIYQGSIPLLKAVSDEIIYITKTPIDVCDSVSEGIGFTPANRILKPIGSMLDRFGNSMNTQIPKHFYK